MLIACKPRRDLAPCSLTHRRARRTAYIVTGLGGTRTDTDVAVGEMDRHGDRSRCGVPSTDGAGGDRLSVDSLGGGTHRTLCTRLDNRPLRRSCTLQDSRARRDYTVTHSHQKSPTRISTSTTTLCRPCH